VCLVLNATVLELEAATESDTVTQAIVSGRQPQRFSVEARVFVLAAGGIDNARILLLSQGHGAGGLANSSGSVGKYFMEHPTMRRGVVVPKDPDSPPADFFDFRMLGPQMVRGTLVPSEASMRQEEILNGMVFLSDSTQTSTSETRRSIAMVRDSLRGQNRSGESGLQHFVSAATHPVEVARVLRERTSSSPTQQRRLRISTTIEQAPSITSQVIIGSRVDPFGQPLPILQWNLGEVERRTVRVLQELVDAWARRTGVGHVEGFLGDERPERMFRGEWHQLGTTRMSASPRSGVVDASLRSHDLENLYIAGGSVFPTVGYANPTLTIMALSLRLAQELDKALSREASLGPIW